MWRFISVSVANYLRHGRNLFLLGIPNITSSVRHPSARHKWSSPFQSSISKKYFGRYRAFVIHRFFFFQIFLSSHSVHMFTSIFSSRNSRVVAVSFCSGPACFTPVHCSRDIYYVVYPNCLLFVVIEASMRTSHRNTRNYLSCVRFIARIGFSCIASVSPRVFSNHVSCVHHFTHIAYVPIQGASWSSPRTKKIITNFYNPSD